MKESVHIVLDIGYNWNCTTEVGTIRVKHTSKASTKTKVKDKKTHLQRGFVGHELHGTALYRIDAIAALFPSILGVLKPTNTKIDIKRKR